MTTFADARHYLDLRAAGWTDPTVDPFELLASLCDEGETMADTMYSEDDVDEKVKDAAAAAQADATEGMLDPEDCSTEEVLEVLAKVIERERNEAEEHARRHMRSAHEHQIEILRAERDAARLGAWKDTKKPKIARKKASQ